MTKIRFIGPWGTEDVESVSGAIKKSLGTGDGGGAEATVQESVGGLAQKRQKRLLDLWRQAGSAAFGDDLKKGVAYNLDEYATDHQCGPGCDHEWLDYSLQKAMVGQLHRDSKGRMYRFNANNRWERFTTGDRSSAAPEPTQFTFPVGSGEFGRGIYFPVMGGPQGYLRLRLRLEVMPQEMISDVEFYETEDDMARDIGLLLTSKGVKAVAQTAGQKVTMLMVRDSDDIEVMGAISGSGPLPESGTYEYHLISIDVREDHILAEVEAAPAGAVSDELSLQKTASKSRNLFADKLSGYHARPNGKSMLDRQLVRAAISRCKTDGVPIDQVKIRLCEGAPDFLSSNTYAFCLPSEGTIYLCAHEPLQAIDKRVKMLAADMAEAVRADAISADDALYIVACAAELNTEWWLEHLIKHYVGAILCYRVQCVMGEDSPLKWHRYIALLAGRGLEFWGDRRTIAECMAEDYRCCHDPSGLPNSVTMLWDAANPAISRMCQQVLMNTLANREEV